MRADGPWVPTADGTYLVYFRNKRCPGCKAFDRVWNKLIRERLDEVRANLVLVYCENFFFQCKDPTASDTFVLFLVNATPQVVVIVVREGEMRYVERHIGFMDLDELIEFANGAPSRMEEALKEAAEEETEEEGEALWIQPGNWKEVVEKLKKMIFEGREIREVCDENGCRFIIS